MNLTPEEKFNQAIWWILQEIKKEGLATRKDYYICFELQSPKSDDNKLTITKEDQRRAIKLLENKGAIRIEKNKYLQPYTIDFIAQMSNIKPVGYFLEILQPKFDEIYEKFRKLNERFQLQHAQIKEIFTNEIIPDQTAEIEKEMREERIRQMERMERERLHREQMKQDRILRTSVDKYIHALDLIIERAEFAGNGNSFSIEFYDFNFEQMIGSKMLEKFLTEMQKDGCFEKYTRINYGGGTRFIFIKVNIKNLKKFKEKREAKSLLSDKKKQEKETVLCLNQNGDLYREPKDRYCYPMGEKSNRYRIIRFLATNKGYQLTEFISTELGIESEKSIRTEIGKIRNNIKKYLKIKGKDLLQGKKESGYRINPKYKVILKNE